MIACLFPLIHQSGHQKARQVRYLCQKKLALLQSHGGTWYMATLANVSLSISTERKGQKQSAFTED